MCRYTLNVKMATAESNFPIVAVLATSVACNDDSELPLGRSCLFPHERKNVVSRAAKLRERKIIRRDRRDESFAWFRSGPPRGSKTSCAQRPILRKSPCQGTGVGSDAWIQLYSEGN